MPYISLTIKKNSKESLTSIFVQKLFIYIFYLTENGDIMMTQSQRVTSKNWCSCLQKCAEHQVTSTPKMTVTKTNVTISLMQPNDVSMGCKVFKVPF